MVLGSGGREHTMVWALAKDNNVDKIYCCPGNGGTGELAENINLDLKDFGKISEFVTENKIDFTIVGPEVPLADGIVDYFEQKKLLIFGPSKYAAKLESSKIFARYFMMKNQIPQPAFSVCDDRQSALKSREKISLPLVVKADGLAAGKGVIICNTEADYSDALDIMFSQRSFGDAGDRITIEECLIGEELSVFAICDGDHYKILNSAQDHKRIFDEDKGPNTGGMGAYSPTPLSTSELLEKVEKRIIQPTLQGMKEIGTPFKGFLYAGIMIVNGDPYVIEFNVRMGDPETQVVLPLLKSSFSELIYAAITGEIDKTDIKVSHKTAVTVVLAAKGYPGNYPKGMKINNIDRHIDGLIFHAGTTGNSDAGFITSGGRVLNVVGFGDNLNDAIKNTYDIASDIHFDNMYYRKDIGKRGLKY